VACKVKTKEMQSIDYCEFMQAPEPDSTPKGKVSKRDTKYRLLRTFSDVISASTSKGEDEIYGLINGKRPISQDLLSYFMSEAK
jgi:hypothetical protein